MLKTRSKKGFTFMSRLVCVQMPFSAYEGGREAKKSRPPRSLIFVPPFLCACGGTVASWLERSTPDRVARVELWPGALCWPGLCTCLRTTASFLGRLTAIHIANL